MRFAQFRDGYEALIVIGINKIDRRSPSRYQPRAREDEKLGRFASSGSDQVVTHAAEVTSPLGTLLPLQ
jgi:hypothetical protein